MPGAEKHVDAAAVSAFRTFIECFIFDDERAKKYLSDAVMNIA